MASLNDLHGQFYVNKEWVQANGTPAQLEWAASTLDGQGHIVVVSNTVVSSNNADLLITKYGPTGDLVWQQTYGGIDGGQDYGVAVAALAGGGFVVAGVLSQTLTSQDIVLLGISPTGDIDWEALWNGSANGTDVPTCLIIAPDGNIYLGGTTTSSLGNLDYVLNKYSSTGALLWSSTYEYSGFPDAGVGLALDADNNPIITGASATGPLSWDYATVKYHRNTGTQIDEARVSVPGFGLDQVLSIDQDDQGHFYITGFREVNGQKDIQTVKITSTFTVDWVVNYDGEGLDDAGRAIKGDDLGNAYVARYSRKGIGGTDLVVMKYDSAGTELWEKRYAALNPAHSVEPKRMAVTNDGGVVVAGVINDGVSDNFITIKFGSDGSLHWDRQYDGLAGNDQALDLLVEGDHVYVCGPSATITGPMLATVKYSTTTKPDGWLYSSTGTPLCVAEEIVVKFNRQVIDMELVDDPRWEFGTLEELTSDSLAGAIGEKLGIGAVAGKRLPVYKIFRWMTSADSITITRLGEEEPVPDFWSTFIIGIGDAVEVHVAMDSLSTMPQQIFYACANTVYEPTDLPNDPLLYRHYSLVPTEPYLNASINMEPAWAINTGEPSIKVGIVDHAVDGIHEDLSGVVIGGYDWYNNTPWDPNIGAPSSHGQACAGIVAAKRNNGIGIAGIAGGDHDVANAPGCSIVSLGTNYESTNAAVAIIHGAGAVPGNYYPGYVPGQFPWFGVHVLNNSYGCYLDNIQCWNPLMRDAMQFAFRNKTVFAAARGNGGSAIGFLPATIADGFNVNDAAALSVGASGTDGAYMSGSTPGDLSSSFSQGMDLIAPGTVRLVTSTADAPFNFEQCIPAPPGYDCFRGTSAAAPHAAGVAALMHSEHNISSTLYPNNLAPEDIERILEKNAQDVVGTAGSPYTIGYDAYNGHGLLDAGATMAQVAYPYYVYHNQPPISSSFNLYPAQLVQLSGNAGGFPDGYYYAERVDATHTYADAFLPNTFILDHWPRESSTTGTRPQNFIDGSYGSTYAAVVTDHTAQVTMTTTGWYVFPNQAGQPGPTWVPTNPYQAKTAYSLHLYKELSVGVQEPASETTRLWPNPATDRVQIGFNHTTASPMDILVVDAMGRLVKRHRVPPGADRDAISLHGLARGVYAARFTWDGEISNHSFVIY
ncbi:MAG: S8 family serine peptidase [Flavobacteriales bacterium]|nr:S8 family serine peptidase [Flavobacteriales bacterium]